MLLFASPVPQLAARAVPAPPSESSPQAYARVSAHASDDLQRTRGSSHAWMAPLAASVACAIRAGRRRVARRRSVVLRRAATADSMATLMARACPDLAAVAEVGESRAGEGLGLFATRSFSEGDEICALRLDKAAIMQVDQALSDKLEGGDFAALAFQVLKASRSEKPSAWKDWINSGVSAPDTHPLKLLLSDPQLAKYLWSCTTCGGQMSGTALQVRDDMEQLQGSTTLEEWTDSLALAMSRSLCEDRDGRPLLILGADLLQAAEEPVVQLKPYYAKEGAVMGLGGSGPERFMGINVVAIEDIEVGTELTAAYLPQPHGGGFLERFGFVPQWLQGDLAESAARLCFAPVDEDEDDFGGVKESCLEDLGLTTAPMSFVFSLSEGILSPRESEDWDSKSELEKMVHLLRFKCCSGTDSFLLDAVYVNRFWYNCNFRISRDNEIAVCQTAIDECNRWLERFDGAEEAEEADPDSIPASSLAKAAAGLRRAEREILISVKTVFKQELDLIQVDDTIRYWADRAMDEAFPDRTTQAVQGY